MTPNDDGLTQRERRRQQHKASKPKVKMPQANMKQWIGPLVILVLVGGAVALTLTGGGDDTPSENACAGHYHYTMDIFLDGQKVVLNPAGDTTFTNVGHHLHMHQSSGADTQRNLIHNHRDGGANPPLPENCFSYNDAFSMLSMTMSEDALTLRPAHGDNAGTYEATDGKSLRVYGKGWEDTEWRQLDLATIGTKVAPESSQFAIVYGAADADAVALLNQQATPYPTTSYGPSDDGHYSSFDELMDKP